MRSSVWLHFILWAILAGGLVTCSPDQLAPTEGSQPIDQPTQKQVSAPMAEGIGPLPEYRLNLELDMSGRRLIGQQLVTVPNRSGVDLNEIVFRLYPNLRQYGSLMGIGPVWVDGRERISSLRAEGTSLVIPLAEPLPPQASVTISLTFDVEIPQRDSGYVLFGQTQGIWTLPDAYALLAVHDGSEWREDVAPPHGDAVFADAAFYEVNLTLPPTLTVAATGSVLSAATAADGRRVHHITGGPLREFAWVASAGYLVAQATAGRTTVRSYYLPGDEAAGKAALSIAAAALRVYEDAFGPYPFAEMAVVEAPLRYYGMEYASMNLIGLDLYRDQRAELENRIAHEIAHQWWYAQVGNDQINTPWLDEGLAEHSTVTYYRQVLGEAQANTLVNQRWLIPYQSAVENGYDAVVNQPSAAFGREYEIVVYAKAALFFEALHQELGDNTFHAVLHEYVTRYRWRIATPEGFLEVAEAVSGQDLDGLYNRWILSKQ